MSMRRIITGCLVCALGLVSASTVSAGLIAWWDLNEGSGTTAGDASGSGNDGTLVGGAEWVAGKDGGGVYLDGVDDYIEVPNLIGETNTMSFWFKPDWDGSDPEDYRLFDASLGAIYFFISKGSNHADINPEEFGFYLEDATDADYQGIEANPDGLIFADTWFHLIVTWEFGGGPAVIYLNGEEIAGASSLGPLPELYENPRFGLQTIDYIPSRHGAMGVIDDIRIYDRTLNAGQAQDLFNGIDPDWRKAEEPEPADGAIGVTAPLFKWGPGETALFHNVYVSTSPELTEADLVAARQPFTIYYHVQGLEPGATYYWRVDEVEADMVTVHPGKVWTFTARAKTAYLPVPADGAMTVSPATTLTWYAGLNALNHQLYLDTDLDAVTQGVAGADQGTLTEATFDPNGLEEAATYYWRVDEVMLDGSVQAGDVWSFTTYAVVDDFEEYTDEEGSRIYETWIDGWTNGTGSTVGYVQAPFAEQTIVHGGGQSMPLDYNNVNAPSYSEGERVFSPAQDWTAMGTDMLLLYVRGRGNNGTAPLYLIVEDSGSRKATVVHPDAEIVKAAADWVQWPIPFSVLTDAGVNLGAVEKLTIGVGDPVNPVADATGLLYIDDIALAKSPPPAE